MMVLKDFSPYLEKKRRHFVDADGMLFTSDVVKAMCPPEIMEELRTINASKPHPEWPLYLLPGDPLPGTPITP